MRFLALVVLFAGIIGNQAEAGEPQALVISASWCGPCKTYRKSILKEMVPKGWKLADYGTRQAAAAHIVWAEDQEGLETTHKVDSFPTTVILKDGAEVWREVGAVPPDTLAEALRRFQTR